MMVPHGFGFFATTEDRAAATLERAALVFLPLVMSASGQSSYPRAAGQCRDTVSGRRQLTFTAGGR
ncbi:hypothetical protein GCM10009660_29390 [Catellatospora bangladeshensis]